MGHGCVGHGGMAVQGQPRGTRRNKGTSAEEIASAGVESALTRVQLDKVLNGQSRLGPSPLQLGCPTRSSAGDHDGGGRDDVSGTRGVSAEQLRTVPSAQFVCFDVSA